MGDCAAGQRIRRFSPLSTVDVVGKVRTGVGGEDRLPGNHSWYSQLVFGRLPVHTRRFVGHCGYTADWLLRLGEVDARQQSLGSDAVWRWMLSNFIKLIGQFCQFVNQCSILVVQQWFIRQFVVDQFVQQLRKSIDDVVGRSTSFEQWFQCIQRFQR